ncbi:unnamed protein product [Durusdinium trenchii]|uniref:Uncharacterized protein n=1 Tax=Durusdinium trenchii TaxID=1381693 RepID=A0ABP0QZV9_9DINO
MEDLWLLKVAAGVTLLGVALIGGLLPLYLERAEVSKDVLCSCNAMAGGVLLAAALVHLLPDAQQGLRNVSLELHGVFKQDTDEPFPLASTLAGIMFLALMMVEARPETDGLN